MWAAVRGNRGGSFAAQTRVLWLAGYAREAWFGARSAAADHSVLIERPRRASQAG
jgi:hypothetical protein